jgi:hypothetical protein
VESTELEELRAIELAQDVCPKIEDSARDSPPRSVEDQVSCGNVLHLMVLAVPAAVEAVRFESPPPEVTAQLDELEAAAVDYMTTGVAHEACLDNVPPPEPLPEWQNDGFPADEAEGALGPCFDAWEAHGDAIGRVRYAASNFRERGL